MVNNISRRPPTKVPKSLTTRFRTNKGSTHTPGLNTSTDNRVFRIFELPAIPPPSKALTALLLKYNGLNSAANKSEKVKGQPKRKRNRRINGFLAFRSFYSASILDIEHQRELSTLLGKIWIEEENQLIWNKLAEAYNIDKLDAKLQFCSWICEASKKAKILVSDTNSKT